MILMWNTVFYKKKSPNFFVSSSLESPSIHPFYNIHKLPHFKLGFTRLAVESRQGWQHAPICSGSQPNDKLHPLLKHLGVKYEDSDVAIKIKTTWITILMAFKKALKIWFFTLLPHNGIWLYCNYMTLVPFPSVFYFIALLYHFLYSVFNLC